MRKLTILLVVLMLCLQVFSGTVAYGATLVGNHIIQLTKSIDGTPSYVGDDFGVFLEFDNNSGSNMENVYLSIDSSSDFYGVPSSSPFLLSSSIGAHYSNTTQPTLRIAQKSAGNAALYLNFTYTIGTQEYTENEVVYINEVSADTVTTPTAPTDTSKYMPKLGTTSGNSIPTIVAGNPLLQYCCLQHC